MSVLSRQFDVLTSTHDEMKDGVAPRRHRVHVSAEYGKDASLVAMQLAAAVHGRMPVDVQERV